MIDAVKYDVVIVGGGIVGLATAHQLINRNPRLTIAIVEKEQRVGEHQSSRNSGVIHSGIYYEPGSQKAINCLAGYKALLSFATEHNVPFDLCGKVIVARKEEELPVLKTLYKRGQENGLEGITWLDGECVIEKEPHVHAVAGIWVPQSGIIDYGMVCKTLQVLLGSQGVHFKMGHPVTAIKRQPTHVEIITTSETLCTKVMVNCAGLYADKVTEMTGMRGNFRILPFRGEFYKLRSEMSHLVNHLVYPVPDLRFPFLGIHFTQRLDGGIEAGPNAVLGFRREGYRLKDVHIGELIETLTFTGFWRMAARYWKKGMDEMYRSFSSDAFHRELIKLLPDLERSDIERSRSGVRAQCVAADGRMIYDYVILEDDQVINVCNAPSPAATSCFSIGQFLAAKAIARMT